jgi:hypothetical protein
MNEAWNKLYKNRKKKEVKYTQPLQMRFSKEQWNEIGDLVSELGFKSKADFVRKSVDSYIKYLKNN